MRNVVYFYLTVAVLTAADFATAQSQPTVQAAVIPNTCKKLEFNVAALSAAMTVDLLVTVDERGKAVSVAPLSGVPDAALLAAVSATAESCMYTPALIEGRPVSGTARMFYQFDRARPAPPFGRRPAIMDVKSCAPTSDDYPKGSLQRNETGTTRINFTVDPRGYLTAFGVVRSSGYLPLDFTALVKLAGCRFQPGTTPDGTPTSASFEVDYVWKIQ
jgi:TonB family protein